MRQVIGKLLKGVKWLMFSVAALALSMLASWFLIPDQDLSNEVMLILDTPHTVPSNQNSYAAMWGLKADPTLDAHIVGKNILDALQQANAQHRKISDTDLQTFWGASPLKLDSASLRFCTTNPTQCLPQIRTARARIESIERELEIYLNRYISLRGYPSFEESLPASLDVPILEYSALNALSDLGDARIALDMANQNKQKTALENLAAELSLWRKIGQNADTLITKMIATRVLHRKFRLAAELLAETPAIAVQYPILLTEITRPLTAREASVDRVFIGEFRLSSSIFQNLARERKITSTDSLNSIPGKLLMIGSFKPNASTNLQYAINQTQRAFYTQPASISIKQMPAFLAEQQNAFSPYSLTTLFYNPAGKVLVYVAPLDWGKYAYALQDLTAYTRLVELQRRIITAHLDADEIPAFLRASDVSLRDPYTDNPMHWDAQSQSMSVKGYGKARDTLTVRVGFI